MANILFKHNPTALLKSLSCAFLAFLGLIMLSSCNSKEDPASSEAEQNVINAVNVAVTSFSLKSDNDVMEHLDSVFFSIDLEHGVIFNADSLPKGTKVDKLVPVIRYSDYVTAATINMEGGTTRTGEVNYLTNPTDSIDFTGRVTLTLAASDQNISKSYLLKLNVHKENPDSMAWGETAFTALPSRSGAPIAAKTVALGSETLSLIQESDGSFSLSRSSDLYANTWATTPLQLSFSPRVDSFTGAEGSLYILDDQGNLLSSADGLSWQPTGESWDRILGSYLDTAVGLRSDASGLIYCQYPARDLVPTAVEADFPVEGSSNLAVHTNKWTSSPVAFLCGGRKADGSLSPATWAFDGRVWIRLSDGGFPAVEGATLVDYYAFRHTSGAFGRQEYEVWILIGGSLESGEFNREVYVSYDNGVNWRLGSSGLQLPSLIPAMTGCDNIVAFTTHSSELSDAWTVTPSDSRRRVNWSVDGNTLSWETPYIYLIGGRDSDGRLCNTIWRGVLNRLRFAPVI